MGDAPLLILHTTGAKSGARSASRRCSTVSRATTS